MERVCHYRGAVVASRPATRLLAHRGLNGVIRSSLRSDVASEPGDARPTERDKGEKAMIARLDHRPIIVAVALATVVSVLLLAVALFVTAGLAPPPSLPSGTLDQIPTHSSIEKTMIL